MSDTRATAMLATLDRLVDRLAEHEIAEAVRQFRNGRESVGPRLRALGYDPLTGKRLASSAASSPPGQRADRVPSTDSVYGYDRSVIERERLKRRHEQHRTQTINGKEVTPIGAIQVPKKHVQVWVPSSHR